MSSTWKLRNPSANIGLAEIVDDYLETPPNDDGSSVLNGDVDAPAEENPGLLKKWAHWLRWS